MKQGIHPETRKVLFFERASGFQLLAESTLKSSETDVYKEDGQEYPVIYVDISSESHPFYTGEQKIIKTGAVDKFYARQKKAEALKK